MNWFGYRRGSKNAIGFSFASSKQDLRWLKAWLHKAKKEFDVAYHQHPNQRDNLSNYRLRRTLGQGSYGRVVLAELVGHKSMFFAIKILSKEKIINEDQVGHALEEKRLLVAVRSPFIVNCVSSFKDTSNLYMVMPFITGGELYRLIKKFGKLPEDWSKFYSAQVLMALDYLHTCGVVYRDLKPENVMLDAIGYCKVTDFGFAKKIQDKTYTLCGTPQYLAPEIILTKPYAKSVDYWSFGILIFELNAGYVPFEHKSPMKMYEMIVEGKLNFPNFFKPNLQHLLSNIIQVDITKRFGNMKDGAMDIYTHDWYKEINFSALHQKKQKAPWLPQSKGPMDVSNFSKFKEKPIEVSKTDLFPQEFRNF